MTKHHARAWLSTFGDLPDELRQSCKYGHRECSTVRGGDCLDEVIQAGVVQVDEQLAIHAEVPA